jgi:hypothetical protein
MLPWGLLAGLIITLLFLAQMRRTQVPGCGPAGAPLAQLPTRCTGLAEGYPLRFLYAYQGVPKIDRLALIKDWAQWVADRHLGLVRARAAPGRPGPGRQQ